MKWDRFTFRECPKHGHHTGDKCPLCDDDTPPPQPEPSPQPDRSSWHSGPEKELHDQFERWLDFHQVAYVHARTDKKSTIEDGWPDFTCLKASDCGVLACLIEFKNATGKLRKDQQDVIERLASQNIPVLVTGNFDEACAFVRAQLQFEA